jgi:2-polyprenyl-3-methyl-5-hydroxy-6-metoxy-1,4-benzoquinol methylase
MSGALDELSLKSMAVAIHSISNDCHKLATEKYGNPPSPYIAARLRAGYFSPEDHYEALLNRFVTREVKWLDVGCGRAPFPNNIPLSSELAGRCRKIVGLDPDSAICENSFVHERCQVVFEEYSPTQAFDLVTARMVIEHVQRPAEFVRALMRATRPGSLVVFFTVNWWSLTTLAAYYSPMSFHHWLKRWIWNTDQRDTFRTEYNMNRRTTLSTLMKSAGFDEYMFWVLPDASILWGIPSLRSAELACFDLARRCGVPYIDSCILAVYRRTTESGVQPGTYDSLSGSAISSHRGGRPVCQADNKLR